MCPHRVRFLGIFCVQFCVRNSKWEVLVHPCQYLLSDLRKRVWETLWAWEIHYSLMILFLAMQAQLPVMMLEEVLQGPEWICWQSLVLQLQLQIRLLILDPLPLSGGWWDLLLLRRQDFWFRERINCWESDQEGVALVSNYLFSSQTPTLLTLSIL